jgi:uncharacterized coiled-coil DUF342 family protein
MKTTNEISLEIDELGKELLKAEQERDMVEEEITKRRREIDEKHILIRDLENSLRKSKANCRELKLNLEQKKREFWRVKE